MLIPFILLELLNLRKFIIRVVSKNSIILRTVFEVILSEFDCLPFKDLGIIIKRIHINYLYKLIP